MSTQTVEELSRRLRDDLAWRRKELRVFEGSIKTAGGSRQQALLRGAIAGVYAHWEGFVAYAANLYLDFVRTRQLQICELHTGFVGLIIRKQVRALATSGRDSDYGNLLDWLLAKWGERAYLPNKEVLSAKSNLNSRVFKDIICCLGLPYREEYQRAEKPVIDALVEARNALAHGEWQRIEQKDFEEYSMWIDRLMVILADSVETAADEGAYRRRAMELM